MHHIVMWSDSPILRHKPVADQPSSTPPLSKPYLAFPPWGSCCVCWGNIQVMISRGGDRRGPIALPRLTTTRQQAERVWPRTMMSTWIHSAPHSSIRAHSSARRAKSAARMEGAILDETMASPSTRRVMFTAAGTQHLEVLRSMPVWCGCGVLTGVARPAALRRPVNMHASSTSAVRSKAPTPMNPNPLGRLARLCSRVRRPSVASFYHPCASVHWHVSVEVRVER